jgi:hypothetical protein
MSLRKNKNQEAKGMHTITKVGTTRFIKMWWIMQSIGLKNSKNPLSANP